MYRLLFSLVIARIPAETVHHLTLRALSAIQSVPGAVPLLRRLLAPRDPALGVRALGLEFPGPLGPRRRVRQGRRRLRGARGVGFGFVEIGTVTGAPQPGNPRRGCSGSSADRALINRMGFNNEGARPPRGGCRRRGAAGVVGVNIGKTKVVPEVDAVPTTRRAPSGSPRRRLPRRQRQLAEHPRPARPPGRGAPAAAADGRARGARPLVPPPRPAPGQDRARPGGRRRRRGRRPRPRPRAGRHHRHQHDDLPGRPSSARPSWSRRPAGCPARR